VFPQSFRDLTLVAGTIGDYAALVVPADSPIEDSMADLLAAYRADQGRDFAVGGGSVPGGMDHLVAAMVMQAAGEDPTALNYIPYDAGGKAMAGLLSGEIDALSTGFSEAIALADQGEVKHPRRDRADERVPYDSAPTFMEQGIDTTFVNWRGFFAAPGLPEEQAGRLPGALADVRDRGLGSGARAQRLGQHPQPGDDFRTFLEAQEKEIGDLMRKLGFL
jgi:putative tricarboxylic transport membrane protein